MAKVELKQPIVQEISENIKDAQSVVVVDYRGLTVAEDTQLRKALREAGVSYKVYKNTLVNRALTTLNIDLKDELNGPKVVAFGKDIVEPIKAVSKFIENHPNLEMKIGIVDGEITDLDTLKKYATIPSRDGLLTMFAGGLIEHVKNVAICLDLHAQNLEKEQ